jgi:hypothetical protein
MNKILTLPGRARHSVRLDATSTQAWRARSDAPYRLIASAGVALILMALAMFEAASSALAQANSNPPERMTFQGFLADGNGNPLGSSAPKNYDLIFRIMGAQTGGVTNWTEQQTVTVDAGNFSVLFGEGTPVGTEPHPTLSSLFATNTASDRFVEITVKGIGVSGDDVTILPRLRLLTSPYAFLAKQAVNAANLVNSSGTSLVTAGGNTVAVSGAITATSFSGNGSGLASLAASNLTGVVPASVLTGVNGSGLTSLTAANLNGILPVSALAGVNGSGLINLNPTNLNGTLPDARLSANVALLNANQTFTGKNVIVGGLALGPNAPQAKLDIQAGADSNGANEGKSIALGWYAGGYRHFIRSRHNVVADNGNAIEFYLNTSNTATNSSGPGTNNVLVMMLGGSGNVGIGTTNPTQAKLQIAGGVNRTGSGLTTYWAEQGVRTWAGGTDPGGLTSIYADNRIVGQGFVSHSDERIKHISGHSDATRDLDTLMKIEVMDYSYVDTVAKGTREQKKLIAQQVEKVFPQAISQSIDVVPDIYQKAMIQDGWVKLTTNLKKGDRVRLLGKKTEGIYEVLEVDEGKFRTDFAADDDRVFVYGREVKDFRSVDYEAIGMLNVSATQELARKVKDQNRELAELRAEVEKLRNERKSLAQSINDLTARDKAWEARFIRLERALPADSRGKDQAQEQTREQTRELSSLTR